MEERKEKGKYKATNERDLVVASLLPDPLLLLQSRDLFLCRGDHGVELDEGCRDGRDLRERRKEGRRSASTRS